MDTVSIAVQQVTKANYSGSRRSSNGWIYRGYDSNHINILTSYPLPFSEFDQERLSRYISKKSYTSNYQDEDYNGCNEIRYSQDETSTLITILTFIFPDISFIIAHEPLPFQIYTLNSTIKYTVNEKEFINKNYNTEQLIDIIQLFKTNDISYPDVMINALIKSTTNDISELIDSIV